MPGSVQQRASYVVAVGAAVEGELAGGQRRASATSARPRARGIGRSSGRRAASVAASGKRWVSPATSGSTGRPCCGDEPAGDGAGAGDADLLAEHRADRDLVAVDVPGHPQPGVGADERAEHRVAGERVVDRDRVAVGVEQPAHALDRGRGVAQVLERERRR